MDRLDERSKSCKTYESNQRAVKGHQGQEEPAAIILKWKKCKVTIRCPRFGATCEALPLRKVGGRPKTTREELVHDLKAVGSTVIPAEESTFTGPS